MAIQPKATIQAHPKPVVALAIAPDGQSLVTGSEDGALTQWATATGQAQRVWQKPLGIWNKDVNSLSVSAFTIAFAPQGHRAVTSWGGFCKLWDAHTGKMLRQLNSPRISAATLAPDGDTVAVAVSPPQFVADPRKRLAAQGAALAVGVAFGVMAGVAARQVAAVDQPGGVALWDSNLKRATLGFALWAGQNSRGLGIPSVAFTPDGKTLAIGDSRSAVQLCATQPPPGDPTLWEKMGAKVRINPVRATLEVGAEVLSLTYAPDSRHLFIATPQTLSLWRDTEQLWAAPAPQTIHACAVAPRANLIATGHGTGTVALWNAQTGALHQTLASGHTALNALAFSKDGSLLAAGNEAGQLWLWPLR